MPCSANADAAVGGTASPTRRHMLQLENSPILIVATTPDGGIGIRGQLPWRIKGDMSFFALVTTRLGRTPHVLQPQPDEALHGCRNVVMMGRKTWTSIPSRFRPLKDRVNVVLSSDAAWRASLAA